MGYDPQRFAMDYHIIGFRECAAEVARYLVTIEGMDIQDPLRLRLMSHLQYFVQQREMSVKNCAATPGASSWPVHPAAATSAVAAAAVGYQPTCGVAPYQSYAGAATSTHASHNSSYVPNLPATLHQYPTLSASPNASNMHTQQQQSHSQQQQQQQSHSQQQQQQHSVRSTSVGSAQDNHVLINHPTRQVTSPQHQQQTQSQQQQQQQQPQTQQVAHPQITPTNSHEPHLQQQQAQQQQAQTQQTTHHHYTLDHPHSQDLQGATYIELTSAHGHPGNHRQATSAVPPPSLGYSTMPPQYPVSVAQEYNHQTGVYVTANGSKPYRPWGAEMAY